jgi:hypothetical protein
MIGKSRRSAVVDVIALTTVLGLALSFTASGQQNRESSLWEKAQQELLKADYPLPTFIKLYSKDGKQSLTGTCKAKDPATGQLVFRPGDPGSVSEVTCTFIIVHFLTPDERPKETPWPSTDEEFIKYALRDIPKFSEELKENSKEATKKAREEFNKGMVDTLCSKESIARLQKLVQEIQIGPKMKAHYQTMINGCRSKDFKTLIDQINTENNRTCGIRVDTFTLDFKRIGKGKWLNNPGPQGLCNVVSVYELEISAGSSFATTLKNTVLTVGGPPSGVPFLEGFDGACKAIREDNKVPMVWSETNNDVFEPTCDFIKHDYILPPIPYQ